MMNLIRAFLILFSCLPITVKAETIRIAVASNFIAPMKVIIKDFEAKTGNKVKASYGSSGKIFAQIQHGAPFDIFFSADQDKPKRLEEMGLTVKGSRFTYAQGQLALCSAKEGFAVSDESLKSGNFSKLAIANPKLAPYGSAAMEVLESLKIEEFVQDKLIIGENISQSFQFISTENADLGFVALSQTNSFSEKGTKQCWIIPNTLYQEIKQDAVVLKKRENLKATSEFVDFTKSVEVKKILVSYGYL